MIDKIRRDRKWETTAERLIRRTDLREEINVIDAAASVREGRKDASGKRDPRPSIEFADYSTSVVSGRMERDSLAVTRGARHAAKRGVISACVTKMRVGKLRSIAVMVVRAIYVEIISYQPTTSTVRVAACAADQQCCLRVWMETSMQISPGRFRGNSRNPRAFTIRNLLRR